MKLLHRKVAPLFGLFLFIAMGPARSDAPAPVAQTLTPNYSLPLPWNEFDIGSVTPAGAATIAGDVFTLVAGGSDIGNRADNFAFIYQGVTGDFAFSARVAKLSAADPDAKAGIMVRDFLASNTNFAASLATAVHGSVHAFRPYYTPVATADAAAPGVPLWVKLINRGGQVNSYVAPDAGGSPGGWIHVGSESTVSTGLLYVGLVASAHSQTAACNAVFDHVVLDFGPQPVFADGMYTLSPASAPEMVLDGASAPAAVIQTPSGAPSQKWNFVKKGDGVYDIQYGPDKTLALSVEGTTYRDADKIVLAPDKGAPNQLWKIAINANGTFGLYSVAAPASGIDDNAGSKKAGFQMDLWKANPNDQHLQWIVNPAQ